MANVTQATDQKRVCRSCSAVLSRYNQDSLCMPCAGTKRREKLAIDLAAEAGTPVTPAIRAEANTIAEHLERRSSHAGPPKSEGQRWCEGCQTYRFAGSFLPSGDCRSCVGPKPEASPSWAVVVVKPTADSPVPESETSADPPPETHTSETHTPAKEDAPRKTAALAPGQWSRRYERCVRCGQTDAPHASRGRCRRCWDAERRPSVTQDAPKVVEEAAPPKDPAAVMLGRLGGLKGGKARAASLTPEQRQESGRKAAEARWAKSTQTRTQGREAGGSALATSYENQIEEPPTTPAVEDAPSVDREAETAHEEGATVVAEPIPEPTTEPAPIQKTVRPPARLVFNDQGGIEDVADYQILHEMLTLLPKDGRWKLHQRTLWLRALTSLMDYLIDEPPCESAGHHACQHFAKVAQKAVENSREIEWCFGCMAERTYDGDEPVAYRHQADCPLAQIVTGDL